MLEWPVSSLRLKKFYLLVSRRGNDFLFHKQVIPAFDHLGQIQQGAALPNHYRFVVIGTVSDPDHRVWPLPTLATLHPGSHWASCSCQTYYCACSQLSFPRRAAACQCSLTCGVHVFHCFSFLSLTVGPFLMLLNSFTFSSTYQRRMLSSFEGKWSLLVEK